MKPNTFLQTIHGFFVAPSNIVFLMPSPDGSKYRAQLRKPVEFLTHHPSEGQQYFAWISTDELRAKGVVK
ncbi:MAG: hypothetical protein H9535_01275 [Ignavibacteria bacterium]|nr:hypothetical protein [Ignavibacteria bacterium]